MGRTPPAWSYSKISTFDTCPKKYEGSYVTNEVPFTDTVHTLYGKELHTAAEEYIRDNKPIDPRFAFIEPYLISLKNRKGDKYCEIKMGIKQSGGQFEACDFFDPDVWCRGVADLVIVDGEVAFVVDYKSSKSARYADTRQLAVMAACVFLKFPEVRKVHGALLFVAAKEPSIVKAVYEYDERFKIFADLHALLTMRETAYNSNVFNAKPNGLCRQYCGVLSCPHNGKR